MARDCIIAGNWKMYKTSDEANSFITEIKAIADKAESSVYLAVPFTTIQAAASAAEGSKVVVGAQNMHDVSEGAFTGEISASMLHDSGATFVILGHSERRHVFGETDEFINRKVLQALEKELQPIVCIGETLEEREAGKTVEVLEQQLKESLADVSTKQMEQLILAYEPVWAIGTGRTATPEMAQEAHLAVRNFVAKQWSKPVSSKIAILYGGSVKPDNARALIDQADIDGALVGGASLDSESFSGIIQSKQEKLV